MRKQAKRVLTLLLALCLGLLPMAATAEEEHTESYTITFDANGGIFSADIGKIWTTHTRWMGAGSHIAETPPDPQWINDDYIFDGWDIGAGASIGNVDFTADATVRAKWRQNSNTPFLPLDPNGGTCPVESVRLDTSGAAPILREELPIPTRPGYDFKGWFLNGSEREIKTGDAYSGDGQDKAVAKWLRTGTQDPVRIDFIPNGGRITQFNGKTIPALVPGDSPYTVDEHTGVDQNSGIGWTDTDETGRLSGLPSAERDGYVFDGWCIVGSGALENAFAGKEVDIPGSAKKADLSTVFKADALLAAKWSEDKDGLFTIKFDLNYKDPIESEIPKDQKVARGHTVNLPDGAKLTCPFLSHEFYAWCIKGADGKLYPWMESAPVTAGMTLYAGWIRRGTAVQSGEALPDTPAETPPAPSTPSTPSASSVFTDVAAASPFAPAISWAVERGVTAGKTSTTFAPGEPCTRAQIITFLWRAAGSPEPKTMEAEYADVTNSTAYFYKAVQWAAEMGMEESGTFRPGDPCTRGQGMYFIWRANGSGSSAGSAPSFTDLSRDSLYYDAVLWAVGRGVTNGTGDGTTFSPDEPCTRGQIVTFLYRAYKP